MALLNRKANVEGNNEGMADFSPFAAGKYIMFIEASEKKQNSNKNGHYWELKVKGITGASKGRYVWVRLNLDNPSSTAVEIAENFSKSQIIFC